MLDARLIAIDRAAQTATFEAAGIQHTGRLTYVPFWEPGIVGALRLNPDGERFEFYVYPDQRLRRAPDRDLAHTRWWSWVIDDHHFYIRAGIIPGIAGTVVVTNVSHWKCISLRNSLRIAGHVTLNRTSSFAPSSPMCAVFRTPVAVPGRIKLFDRRRSALLGRRVRQTSKACASDKRCGG
jgi:hypothetical protein